MCSNITYSLYFILLSSYNNIVVGTYRSIVRIIKTLFFEFLTINYNNCQNVCFLLKLYIELDSIKADNSFNVNLYL